MCCLLLLFHHESLLHLLLLCNCHLLRQSLVSKDYVQELNKAPQKTFLCCG